MEIYTTIMSLLNVVITLAAGVATDASTSVFGADYSFLSFSVQSATKCTEKTCPGSFYTAITTAWANIGYVTHADVLRFLNTSHFGKWAILLYIAAAVGGLIGVATNSPMRNYTWFFIGPALFSFLVGTTMKVQGVNWVVANRVVEDMSEVWRNAEAGLANTKLVKDGLLEIKGKYGPQGQYEVAMPMVFLDELFSATSNLLIDWTGIGRQVDNGGGESNLSNRKTSGKDAWWLVSNLKWSYIESLTANTIRNPDVRDAFVTFLASECGDAFKQGIDSASYIAATQARGAATIETVFNDNDNKQYQNMHLLLGGISIPTPRSLGRLFKEKVARGEKGSFLKFSPALKNKPRESGRGEAILCHEYLWTIIQALRYEAGSAYYQLIRSAPDGFEEEGFVETLFYGWDVREKIGDDTDLEKQRAFLKHLILAYIIRNELIAAPQITTVDQRYAPAEQSRSYSEANIRSYGSKGKFIEIYNAAIMMPYLQGVLAYFLIVAYPIACMMVILPGHYKAFFTWVSFFAWIKLWDVGFAMVHVLERSVWAMLGNNSYMGAKARVLVEVAKKVGTIGVSIRTGVRPSELEPLTNVCSLPGGSDSTACAGQAVDQTYKQAFELLDQMLVVGGNIDLDLSNGWYIYIMSALYLAVPAVTGQLVLGAKAGSAGLVKDAFSAVGNDGAQAAKTGAQHQAVSALTSNQGSLGQAAYGKSIRQSGLAAKSFAAANAAMDLQKDGTENGLVSQALSGAATTAGKVKESFNLGWGGVNAAGKSLDEFGKKTAIPWLDKHASPGSSGSKGGSGGSQGEEGGIWSKWGGTGMTVSSHIHGGLAAGANIALGRAEHQRSVAAVAAGQDLAWNKGGADLKSSGYNGYSRNLGSQAEFEAQSAAWEAKNAFASHASAMAGIAGMNAGSLSPGHKPQDMTGMAMSGALDSYTLAQGPETKDGERAWSVTDVSGAAAYSGTDFQDKVDGMMKSGLDNYGSSYVAQPWVAAGGPFSALGAEGYAVSQGMSKDLSPGSATWANFVDSSSDGSYGHVQEANPIVSGARKAAKLPEVVPPTNPKPVK